MLFFVAKETLVSPPKDIQIERNPLKSHDAKKEWKYIKQISLHIHNTTWSQVTTDDWVKSAKKVKGSEINLLILGWERSADFFYGDVIKLDEIRLCDYLI